MATYDQKDGMQTRYNPTTKTYEKYTGSGWTPMSEPAGGLVSGKPVGVVVKPVIVTPKPTVTPAYVSGQRSFYTAEQNAVIGGMKVNPTMQTRYNQISNTYEKYTGSGWSAVDQTGLQIVSKSRVIPTTPTLPQKVRDGSGMTFIADMVPTDYGLVNRRTQYEYGLKESVATSPSTNTPTLPQKVRDGSGMTFIADMVPTDYGLVNRRTQYEYGLKESVATPTVRTLDFKPSIPTQSELHPQNNNVSNIYSDYRPVGAPITQLPDYSDTKLYSQYSPPKDETKYHPTSTFIELVNPNAIQMALNKPHYKPTVVGSGVIAERDYNMGGNQIAERDYNMTGGVSKNIPKPKYYDSTMNPVTNPFGYVGTGIDMGHLTPANITLMKERERVRDTPVYSIQKPRTTTRVGSIPPKPYTTTIVGTPISPRTTAPPVATVKNQKVFTIVNFDTSLSNMQVQQALNAGVTSKNVKYDVRTATEADKNMYTNMNINNLFVGPSSNQSNTVLLFNNPAIQYGGYANPSNSSAIVNTTDLKNNPNFNQQLGMRILHETEHAVGLASDDMYTTQKTGFNQWLTANNKTNYLDLYSNPIKQDISNNTGLTAQNDFHNWLADSNPNAWYYRKQRQNTRKYKTAKQNQIQIKAIQLKEPKLKPRVVQQPKLKPINRVQRATKIRPVVTKLQNKGLNMSAFGIPKSYSIKKQLGKTGVNTSVLGIKNKVKKSAILKFFH
jgi:hypothetical protein